MLPVQSILDVVVHVNLVDHLIGVFLQGRRKDDYLVVLRHELNELHATRAHEEKAVLTILDVVDQRFVEIEH